MIHYSLQTPSFSYTKHSPSTSSPPSWHDPPPDPGAVDAGSVAAAVDAGGTVTGVVQMHRRGASALLAMKL